MLNYSRFLTPPTHLLVKLLNPRLTYVCDPVLGDDGRCYVPEPLVEMYR